MARRRRHSAPHPVRHSGRPHDRSELEDRQAVPGFGDESELDLRKGFADGFPNGQYSVTSPPAIYRDLLITGEAVPEAAGPGPRGDIRAFDIRTGKLAWQFRTWAGDPKENRTGVNVWSIMTVNTDRGIVYLPIGSATYDFYGGDRKGSGLYANCLVALDAATGKVLWSYQLVHHDLWDYDLPAPPALVTVKRGGREIPALAQVTKMGLVFLFDRVTGRPIYPIRETRISSHVWKSQGRFTPWGTGLTLVFPGTLGGDTWPGGSFDPARGYLSVNTNEIGAVRRMEPQPDGAASRYRRTRRLRAILGRPSTPVPAAAVGRAHGYRHQYGSLRPAGTAGYY
ncbi:MAG: quinoprotein glucose dehydrogenase [Bryobacterales bacterium]|nr:quinoprotein glucose dehydrogenase [Bryobacterales bacterium]